MKKMFFIVAFLSVRLFAMENHSEDEVNSQASTKGVEEAALENSKEAKSLEERIKDLEELSGHEDQVTLQGSAVKSEEGELENSKEAKSLEERIKDLEELSGHEDQVTLQGSAVKSEEGELEDSKEAKSLEERIKDLEELVGHMAGGQEKSFSARIFKRTLIKNLTSFFGRQHLGLKEEYKDSMILLGTKFTINTVAKVLLDGVDPGVGSVIGTVVEKALGEIKLPVKEKAKRVIKDNAVEALSDKFKDGMMSLIGKGVIQKLEGNEAEALGVSLFTSFYEIDKISSYVADELCEIYRPFIEQLTQQSASFLADSATRAIKYYVDFQCHEGEALDGAKIVSPGDLVIAVGRYYPVLKWRFQLSRKDPYKKNGLQLETVDGELVSDIKILLGSKIHHGDGGGKTYKTQAKKLIYWKLGWNKAGIVYVASPDIASEESSVFSKLFRQASSEEYVNQMKKHRIKSKDGIRKIDRFAEKPKN